jgi:hypothetical protein
VNSLTTVDADRVRINVEDRRIDALRQLSAEQLLHLGIREVGYVRPGMFNGEAIFMLYLANGRPMMMARNVEAVAKVAAEHGLGFITLH